MSESSGGNMKKLLLGATFLLLTTTVFANTKLAIEEMAYPTEKLTHMIEVTGEKAEEMFNLLEDVHAEFILEGLSGEYTSMGKMDVITSKKGQNSYCEKSAKLNGDNEISDVTFRCVVNFGTKFQQ